MARMEGLLGALLVFSLRVTDVSIGTLRVLYAVRGHRLVAAVLGLLESGIFILAISRVFQDASDPLKMIGYASGFAVGTLLGMTLEKWIGSGFILARVISREKAAEIRQGLRDAHFGVTTVRGEGREGPVAILFIVAARKRTKQLVDIVSRQDAQAFVTIEPSSTAMGGYIRHMPLPEGVRK